MKKKSLHLALSVISALAAALGIASAIKETRLVVLITIFAGGFASGAAITSAIILYRKKE